MRHLVVGTAGHIDHGKSSLVLALTGTDPDRLKEEKARGITVDLGFAHFDHEGVRFQFVDVPGHERFVRNMLAGAAGFDVVLLAVAADESVMPQTVEHIEICRLLGVRRAVAALTRTDLVDDPDLVELSTLEVGELLESAGMASAPILPVSSKTGAGLPRLRAALLDAAAGARPRDPSGPFRLPVDRAFRMRGFGVVVTGTLVSGRVRVGAEVELLPDRTRARVRGLQVHGEPVGTASAGQRVALNLAATGRLAPERGSVLAFPGEFAITRMLDVHLRVLDWAAGPVADEDRIHLHLGTAVVLARVRLLGGRRRLPPGEAALAQLRLEAPVTASRGDRFIIRRYSPVVTIGGGEVLDAGPPKRSPRTAAALARVRALRGTAPDEAAAAFLEEAGAAGLTEAALARRLGRGRPAAAATLERLAADGRIEVVRGGRAPGGEGDLLLSRAALRQIENRLLRLLADWESRNRLRPAVAVEHLREQAAVSPGAADHALARLAAAGRLDLRGGAVATAGRVVPLTPGERTIRNRLARLLEEGGYTPPTLAAAADTLRASPELVDALRRLLAHEGRAVAVSPDLYFDAGCLAALRREVVSRAAGRPGIHVGWFKEQFGLSRKHAIPLLEWLDRERITVRVGNLRRLRASALPEPPAPAPGS